MRRLVPGMNQNTNVRLRKMKKTTSHIVLAGAIAGILGAAPAARAHQYYNLTGSGSIASGDSAIGFGVANSVNGTDGVHLNSNGTNRVANGTNTYNTGNPGLNNFIPGTGTAATSVLNAGSPTGDRVELGGNLPYHWYAGQHTKADGVTKRGLFTGSSATDNTSNLINITGTGNGNSITLPNGEVITAPSTGTWGSNNTSGLWRAYSDKNGGTNAATWGTIMTDLPVDGDHPYLAVGANSWNTGIGLDTGLIHVSCGANTAADNCASLGDIRVTLSVKNDSDYASAGLSGLLDVALYRGTDTSSTSSRSSGANIGGAGMQGSDLGAPIWTASMSSLSDLLFHSFVFNPSEWAATDKNGGDGIHEHGFYTLVIGTQGANNVAYDVLVTTSPVPVPAAAWLFGGALASLIGANRRRKALA